MDDGTELTPLFQLFGIAKEFEAGQVGVRALQGVDLLLPPGEFVALMGPSGSGKTTLLNILGLIERPTAGKIFFSGRDVSSSSEAELTSIRRKDIGFVFQNFNLVPVLTARENVEYALYLEAGISGKEITERARQVLSEVGLKDQTERRPSQMSGGQRQRVAIARALVKRPKVILADEPTANLDSDTAGQFLELLVSLKNRTGTTIIIATHDPVVAQASDRCVSLKDGKIQTPVAREKGLRHSALRPER